MIWGMEHVELPSYVLRKAFDAIDAEKHRRMALARNRSERADALVDAFVDKTYVMLGVERRQMGTLGRYFDLSANPPTLKMPPDDE